MDESTTIALAGAISIAPSFAHMGVPEEESEGKYCMTCFKEFGLKRYLWKYCCKSINRYEHDYCLSEQCPGKNGTPQDTNDFGTAWLHDDESLNKYGRKNRSFVRKWHHGRIANS